MALNPLDRRRFDFEVLRGMQCPTFAATAYASVDDLEAGRRPITDVGDAGRATTYRLEFRIPTLIGPGRLAPLTVIGADIQVTGYPETEPRTWVITSPVPWSPHFLTGAPVCLGREAWRDRAGHVTLGHLAEHIARMLNWDEVGRGAGYGGYNRAAIEYHRDHYGGRPLDPHVRYPHLPTWLTPAASEPPPRVEFGVARATTGLVEWSRR